VVLNFAYKWRRLVSIVRLRTNGHGVCFIFDTKKDIDDRYRTALAREMLGCVVVRRDVTECSDVIWLVFSDSVVTRHEVTVLRCAVAGRGAMMIFKSQRAYVAYNIRRNMQYGKFTGKVAKAYNSASRQGRFSEQTPWPLVRERTIPTERLPLIAEI
jgi:hypothetical protein